MVFRSLKGDAPSNMNDMFTRVNNSTARSLGNAEVNLRLPLLKSVGEGGRNASRTEALSFGTVLVVRLKTLQPGEASRQERSAKMITKIFSLLFYFFFIFDKL